MNSLGMEPKERVKTDFLSAIYHELHSVNPYAFQLSQHGNRFRQHLSNLPEPITVDCDSDGDSSVDETSAAGNFGQSMSVPSSQFQVCKVLLYFVFY
jgi:hypothetical protein